jgi:type II secretory pathway pseudopilin PulG
MVFPTVNCKKRCQAGYTLVGVLLLVALLSIMMAMALPVWDRIKQRENEEELIFRGNEYIEAIARYHTKFNSYPPDLETLQKMKFIRKLYKDPMTESGEWKLLHPESLVETGEAGFINQPGSKDSDKKKKGEKEGSKGEKKEVVPGLGGIENRFEDRKDEEGEEKSMGPVVGIVSRSKKTSLRLYNGQSSYDKWVFAYVPQQAQQLTPQPQPPGKKPDQKKQPDKSGKQPLSPQQPQDQTPEEQ